MSDRRSEEEDLSGMLQRSAAGQKDAFDQLVPVAIATISSPRRPS